MKKPILCTLFLMASAYLWLASQAFSESLASRIDDYEIPNDQNQELYLVVGSTRRAQNPLGYIRDRLHDQKNCDFSHRSTFQGRATTIDFEPSVVDAPHIQGDACTYDFASYRIAGVYLERPPTNLNTIPRMLANLAPHMPVGAALEIELDPYYSLALSQENANSFVESIRENPFHGWHNYFVDYQSLMAATAESFDSEAFMRQKYPNVDQALIEEVMVDQGRLRAILHDIADKTAIPFEHLCQRVRQELTIYNDLMELDLENPDATSDWWVSLPQLQNTKIHNYESNVFTKLFESRQYISLLRGQIGSFEKLHKTYMPNGSGLVPCWYYSAREFFQDSFINYLLSFYAVEKNAPFIEEFLSRNGFANISVTVGQSPHNGRKNVWLVKAAKAVEERVCVYSAVDIFTYLNNQLVKKFAPF